MKTTIRFSQMPNKRQNIAKRNIKSMLFVVILATISLNSSARHSFLFDNNSLDTNASSSTILAQASYLDPEEVSFNYYLSSEEFELSILIIEETESNLKPWMLCSELFSDLVTQSNTEFKIVKNSCEVKEEKESHLEKWMLDTELFSKMINVKN
jgi:hypothetical protein